MFIFWLSCTIDSRSFRFFSRFSFWNEFKIIKSYIENNHMRSSESNDKSQGENDVRKFLTQKMFYKDPRYLRKLNCEDIKLADPLLKYVKE